ncbi:MAG: ABC transporter substrate-binding protein [Treponema sp.]|jgi:polar amino acid transport system substrate-binding protein|nr:ABC transporter substrate-binding protein [Treponema sp.]
MNAKKILAVVIAALVLASGVLAGCKKKEAAGLTKTPGVLTVGMEIGYPPFEYYDVDGKTPIGFDVQMAKALADKLGLKVEFVDTAWDGIFAGVTKGDYDCIMSASTITPERLAVHNFTRPYIGNAQAMVVLKGSPITAQSPEDCAGLGVAYQGETTSDIFMQKYAAAGVPFTPYEYEKVMSCFDELKLRRVDVVVCDSTVAADYLAEPGNPYEIRWQGEADEFFGVCLKKGNDALTAELDKALDALFADGTMLKLSQEIFGMDLVSAARK